MYVWGDGLCGCFDVAQVGLVKFVKRRGSADDHNVSAGDAGVIRCRAKTGAPGSRDFRRRNAVDVGFVICKAAHLSFVDIETGYPKLLLREKQRKRQAHIAEADNAYEGG